ncbi:hypothetical protein [Coleofasciculus sp. G2-EDA-02]|uniref:hypothetical protein n=1 Tax=Coleofasciculus sp. G2-EDA-02 TaxID=3069529 RepID=UPI0033049BF3
MIASTGLDLGTRLILRLDKEIEFQLNTIIPRMQDIAQEFEIEKADKKSPFRNILSFSTETFSLEAIKTQIRYQIGRSESSRVWKIQKPRGIFASVVVNQLEELIKDAKDILSRVKNSLREEDALKEYLGARETLLEQDIHLKLTRLYLGYLAREHTARVGEIKFSNAQELEQKSLKIKPNKNLKK